MPESPSPPEPSREDRADRIVADLREDWNRGEHPDLQAVLTAHPDLEDLLRPRFAAIRMIQDAFDELRSSDIGPLLPPIGSGTRLGPYRLGTPLGAGGMGTVYLARVEEETARLERGRRVAVKVVHPHLLLRSDVVKRFKREAEIGRRVDHENVVATLDTGTVEHGGSRLHYLVTEYVEGRTLRDLADDMRRVPEALLTVVAEQCAAGLAAIHHAGIVHRDLKPENILLTRDNRVRVMDLGMARLVDASVQLTQDGEFAGSLLYAAPEHLRGHQVGPASDLFGLGLVLYELLAGVRPFTHEQVAACIQSRVPPPPPSLRDRGLDVSAFFAEVVQTLLAERPEGRFDSADHLRQVLGEGEASAWWAERAAAGASRPAPIRISVTRRVPLRGRTHELEQVRRIWGAARGGQGSTVLLSGEPGIGKTRLVAEIAAEIRDAETLYTSFAAAGGVGAITDALIDRFGSAGLEETLRPFLRQAPGLAKMIARFARHEVTPTSAYPPDGDGVSGGLVRLLQGLATARPLVWVFEDLELASLEARAIVFAMARAAQDLPTSLLLTTSERPGEADLEALSRLERFERIHLARLQDHEVRRILAEVFEDDILSTPIGREVVRKVDGVPFFLFELLHGLESDGAIERLEDGLYRVEETSLPPQLPANLRHVVRGRLTRLTESQRMLIDLAAVQGFQFDAGLLAAVLDRPPIAVLRELAEIERRSGVIKTSGRLHRFDHPLLPEVVYAELAPELRSESHDLLARAREARDDVQGRAPEAIAADAAIFLAHHHLRGANPDAARPYLVTALERLGAAYREDEALELTKRVLAVEGLLGGEARVRFLLQRSRHLDRAGRRPEALAGLIEAKEMADAGDHRALRAEVMLRLGHAQDARGATDTAKETFEQARRLADELGAPSLQAAALLGVGSVAVKDGRPVDALAHFEGSLRLAQASEDRRQELETRTQLGVLLKALDRLDEAITQHERSITIARDLGDIRGEACATGNLGIALFRLGRFEEARACQQRRLNIAEELGDLAGEAVACGNLGNICMSTGELDEARRWHERDLTITREIADIHGERMAAGNLATAWARLGRRDDARRVIENQIARCTMLGDIEATRIGVSQLADLCRVEGNFADAERGLLRACELGQAARDTSFAEEQRARYALLLAELGEAERARETAEQAVRSLREASLQNAGFGTVLLHQGGVHLWQGRLQDAETCLREARDLLSVQGFGFGQSTCVALLGTLAVERGEADEARRLFEEARRVGENVRAGIAMMPMVQGLLALGDLDAQDAVRTVEAWEQLTPAVPLLVTRFTLFEHTGDRAHAREARRLLDHLVAHAPERCRGTMLDAVPLYRAVMDATG